MADVANGPLTCASAAEWRAWLTQYHEQFRSVWLVITKKGAMPSGLGYAEAVEEAICFGWVDGQARRHDERTFLLLFSPRRPNSVWSVSNIERVTALTRAHRMTPDGLAAVAEAKRNGQWEAALRREQVDVIPEDLEAALLSCPGARQAYAGIRPSRRKQLLYALDSAKRRETRARRLQAILDEVRALLEQDDA